MVLAPCTAVTRGCVRGGGDEVEFNSRPCHADLLILFFFFFSLSLSLLSLVFILRACVCLPIDLSVCLSVVSVQGTSSVCEGCGQKHVKLGGREVFICPNVNCDLGRVKGRTQGTMVRWHRDRSASRRFRMGHTYVRVAELSAAERDRDRTLARLQQRKRHLLVLVRACAFVVDRRRIACTTALSLHFLIGGTPRPPRPHHHHHPISLL